MQNYNYTGVRIYHYDEGVGWLEILGYNNQNKVEAISSPYIMEWIYSKDLHAYVYYVKYIGIM